ncbi:MAG: HlyC/CorC family transporter [Chloroflexi bacterium]|nr:HlyC/CorC family transporter [Chloroflexota bacterium]
MDSVNSLYVVLFLISLLLSAFFCSAETAFISMQRLRLQHLVHIGHPGARQAAKIMAQPERFLATVLLCINIFETAVATMGTIIAVSLWGENLGIALATILITILTLILAEFIPKSLAARHGEKLALAYARPIEVISTILYPVVFVLNHIGLRIARLANETSQTRPTISEEEFHTAIRIGEAEGVMEESAAEMLHNVFEFGDRRVREVMVPRPEVVFVGKGATLAEFLAIYEQSPRSRFPVYEGNQDNVVGILSSKDVLIGIARGTVDRQSTIDSLVRSAFFTPENKPISQLFAEMRDNNCRMIVVVDEFGAAVGVATLGQLTEEIVGPLSSEIGAEKEYEIINDTTFQIDGGMRVEEVNEQMRLEIPEGDYDTIAGFILNLLGRVPKQGEQLRYRDLKIFITRMQGPRIAEVLVRKEVPSGPPKDTDAPAQDAAR